MKEKYGLTCWRASHRPNPPVANYLLSSAIPTCCTDDWARRWVYIWQSGNSARTRGPAHLVRSAGSPGASVSRAAWSSAPVWWGGGLRPIGRPALLEWPSGPRIGRRQCLLRPKRSVSEQLAGPGPHWIVHLLGPQGEPALRLPAPLSLPCPFSPSWSFDAKITHGDSTCAQWCGWGRSGCPWLRPLHHPVLPTRLSQSGESAKGRRVMVLRCARLLITAVEFVLADSEDDL